MSEAIGKTCRGNSQEHQDAIAVISLLMDEGGSSPLPNAEIAYQLGFTTRRGKTIEVDQGRFYRARNHVKDRVWKDGKPCCGYQLHYREIKGEAHLALIDPTGDLGEHAVAAVANLRGWMARERQHQTESLRQIASFEALADHALARGDKDGYRLCQRAIIDLDDLGTVRPKTMAELNVWVDALAS